MLWLIWLIPMLVTPMLAGVFVWWQLQPNIDTTPVPKQVVEFGTALAAGAEPSRQNV